MPSFLWWLIIGLVAGGLARLIMPGKDAMSLGATIVLGIAGSIVGGLVSWAIWGASEQGVPSAGLFLSLLGAIVLLFVWRAYKSRTTI